MSVGRNGELITLPGVIQEETLESKQTGGVYEVIRRTNSFQVLSKTLVRFIYLKL